MMARTKISPFLEAEPPSEASKYGDALLAREEARAVFREAAKRGWKTRIA
jgi:hypothetical protein